MYAANNDKALPSVSGGFLGEVSRAAAAAASVPPCRKISIRLVLPENPAGIVKRKAGRDNSVGVERGFRRNGILAECPCLYPRRGAAQRGVAKENNRTLLLILRFRDIYFSIS